MSAPTFHRGTFLLPCSDKTLGGGQSYANRTYFRTEWVVSIDHIGDGFAVSYELLVSIPFVFVPAQIQVSIHLTVFGVTTNGHLDTGTVLCFPRPDFFQFFVINPVESTEGRLAPADTTFFCELPDGFVVNTQHTHSFDCLDVHTYIMRMTFCAFISDMFSILKVNTQAA